jgi:pseudouridine kinase
LSGSILVIGGANIDIKARIGTPVSHLSTSHPGSVWRTPGGVGRNIAVNLARLGATVHFVGAFGDDADGVLLREDLADSGVDASPAPVIPGRSTGTYVAVLSPDGELVAAVADMSVMDELTPDHLAAQSDLFSQCTVVCIDANLSEATLACALDLSTRYGARTVVEPVSVQKARKLRSLLEQMDTITPNRDELAAISGLPTESLEDVERAAQAVLDHGTQCVLVTLGKDGVMACTQTGSRHYPVAPAQVVDATGAGDAFTAGVVYGYHQDWPLAECVEYGQSLSRQIISTSHSVLGGSIYESKTASKSR